MTEARDIHGTHRLVRNGEILQVGNSSQEYAASLLDFAFAYDNDVDKVESIIKETAQAMRKAQEWTDIMTSGAEVWGMQHVSGEQFILRTSIRTLPNQQ